jgi:methenyltetrahydromethanopterin cyclohydrolase
MAEAEAIEKSEWDEREVESVSMPAVLLYCLLATTAMLSTHSPAGQTLKVNYYKAIDCGRQKSLVVTAD